MKQASLLRARIVLTSFLIFGVSASAWTQPATPRAMPPLPPICDPNQLSFGVDSESGQFDGTSHSGTLLVLRNLGPNDCSVPARPELSFLDDKGPLLNGKRQPLPASPSQPGMHPGPVILPVAVPAGAELTSEARWVSSDAFDANNCVSPESIALSLGSHTFVAPVAIHMCGPAGQHPTYSVTPWHRDPPYEPSRR